MPCQYGASIQDLFSAPLLARCDSIEPVGSQVTVNPPPEGSDHDYLILARDIKPVEVLASLDGFCKDGSNPINGISNDPEKTFFVSLKRDSDSVNIIITDNYNFFKRFMAATSIAKRFNLKEKADRIALFQAVLYGNECN